MQVLQIPAGSIIRMCGQCRQPYYGPPQADPWVRGMCPPCWKLACHTVMNSNRSDITNGEDRDISALADVKCYFVTFTASHDISADQLYSRIYRVIENQSYPVIDYFGCFEYTKNQRLHAHVVFVHSLKRDKGKIRYPPKSFYQRCNEGDMIDKKSATTPGVIDYIVKFDDNAPKGVDKVLFGNKNDVSDYILSQS